MPTTLTYYLTPRDSAGTYARQSLAVLRTLSEGGDPHPLWGDPRIERIELQNRRLRWSLSAIALLGAMGAVALPAMPDARPIRAMIH